MNVLVACEESQAVCKTFREKGHQAFSCDIIDCSGGHPEWHIKQDVLPLLNGNCSFKTCDGGEWYIHGKWDMIIAFPPCTHLSVSGARWFTEGKKPIELQYQARDFFMKIANADCDKIVIENPVGRMSTYWRKPDQIINPWQFGHTTNKKTCLWIKGLPLLKETNVIPKEERTNEIWLSNFNGKSVGWGTDECRKMRSKTFEGIAKAMAEQWG
jgi:site-specific DNA-cytosine methylase